MSRRSTPGGTPAQPRRGTGTTAQLETSGANPEGNGSPKMSGMRETVESFVLVFLFFLVLGVQAEGFVIPTGSMAPTLMGRHKEVTCPECGNVYAVNADREVASDSGSGGTGLPVLMGTCDNCRYPANIADLPSFQGDRIYVMKTPIRIPLLTELGEVRLGRWDVGVFKLPEGPETRYIKRLVGLPGEIVRIHRGDIWLGPLDGSRPFCRAIRPLTHQDAMQVLVYDDTKRAKTLASDPRWTRWVNRGAASWVEREPARYTITPESSREWSELRYRNMVPDPAQWAAILQGSELPRPPRATLVTDFYAYNTDLTAESQNYPLAASKPWRQPHWVGDLTLRFRLEVKRPTGRLRIGLVKAGVTYGCEIDLSSGIGRLARGEEPLGRGGAPTGISGPGTYDIVLSNVDDRLTFRVNGNTPMGEGRLLFPTENGPGDSVAAGGDAESVAPKTADLEPAMIAVRDADVVVSQLKLTRDIYYTIDPAHADFDSVELTDPLPTDPIAFFDWLADPAKFSAVAKLPPRDFAISPGHYLMLGDNSPWSADGRAWRTTDQIDPENPGRGWDNSGRQRWEVPESHLIGKAFCVYWPHLKPFGPAFRVGRDLRLPARPYIEKMRWIR